MWWDIAFALLAGSVFVWATMEAFDAGRRF